MEKLYIGDEMRKADLSKRIMASAFVVAGLTMLGQDAKAQIVMPQSDNNDSDNLILDKKSKNISKSLKNIKLMGNSKYSEPADSHPELVNSHPELVSGSNNNVTLNSFQGLSDSKNSKILNRVQNDRIFANGITTGAAAPTPTLDAMQTNATSILPTASTYFGATYVLTELTSGTAPAGTTTISFNGKRYYYTTPTTLDNDKANMLNYLSGSTAVALTSTGATAANAVFSIGGTKYTFDTSKLPTSGYAWIQTGRLVNLTEGTNSDYDVKVNDGSTTNYYNINIDPSKVSHIGSKVVWTPSATQPSGPWTDYNPGSKVTVDTTAGTVAGAIRLKTPHNGTVPSTGIWNKWFTYTYTKPSTYSFISNNIYTVKTSETGTSSAYKVATSGRSANVITNAIDSTIATGNESITNKTYANNVLVASFSHDYNIIGGGAILNQGTIGDVVADFVGNRIILSAGSYSNSLFMGGAIANVGVTSGKTAYINSITGDFVGNSSSSSSSSYYSGGAISNYAYQGTASATIGSIVGDFVGNSSSSYSTSSGYSSYGGAISNYANSGTASIGSIVGDFVDNSSFSYLSSSSGGAISNYANQSTASATIGSIVGDFVGNFSTSFSTSNYSSGGAISNYAYSGTASIGSIVGDFVGNSSFAARSGCYSSGGAISNYANSGTASIGSIVGDFVGNSSSSAASSSYSSGGAISNYANSGTASIGSIVGDFTGNYAKTTSTTKKAYGGAIFNGYESSGTTQYREKAQITLAGNTFTGNYTQQGTNDPVPNSIYNAGVINIANGATVTINDGYDGMSQAQLNIGSGSIFNLSVDNAEIQTDNLGTVTNNGTINWDLDVDFTNTQTDKISVASLSGTSSVIIHAINLMSDPTVDGATISILTSESDILKTAYSISGGTLRVQGSTGWWDVTYDNTSGDLIFNAAVVDSLAIKVHTGDPKVREYNMTALETVGENLGNLEGDTGAKLTVNGGGKAINGGDYTGISVASGRTLEFNNVSDVTGFADDTAVTNGGTLNISGSKFTSKIANNASMTLSGTNTLNGAISGTNGQTVISTGTTTVGADLRQKDLTVESGAKLNINANNLKITNTISSDGQIELTGGELTSSIANKTAGTSGSKRVQIKGNVSVANGTTITQDIKVDGGKSLTANVASIKGNVNNGGSLNIFSHDDITSTTTHFTQDVTGDGTTNINRNVNVDGSIANNVVIDKYVDSSVDPAVTYYANVVVGPNGSLGTTGKTIEIKAGDGTNYNTLAIGTGSIAADSITNNSKLVLNNSTSGTLSKAISGSGTLDIATTGDNADNVVVGVSSTITNQAITVEKGIFQLGTGASLAGTSAVVVNSGAGINSINGAINNYTTGSNTVTLSDGARAYVDITGNGTTAEIDKFIADANSTITLSNLNVLGAVDIPAGEVQLLSAGKVQGESLFIQSSGETVAVQGTGRNDGSVRVGMTPTSDKLNGAVYVSGAVDAITYSITDDHGETVNNNSQPALGYIKDSFKIQSGDSAQKTIAATAGTKGIIVDENKKLTLDNVKFENFATGTVSGSTDSYNGDYKGIITVKSGAKLDVENSYFAVADTDGNTKKIAIANYGTVTSDPTTYNGAIINYSGAKATITGDTFENIDRTGENGGGIYNESTSTHALVLNNVTATGNKAANGGVLYNEGVAEINGGTYSGNSATALGGAIYSSADLTVNADAVYGAVSFSNNTHGSSVANDIYMAGATGTPIELNLNAADTATNTITLNSGVAGANYNVNVNDGTTGKVTIASLANAGTIALKGGELDLTSDTSASALTASSATLKASSTNGVVVDTLTVVDGETFVNDGTLTVNTTLTNGSSTANKGTIDNKGTLSLNGSNMTNVGDIKSTSTGNLNIGSGTTAAKLTNSGSITGNEIVINKLAELESSANATSLKDKTDTITNNGILTLTGGTLTDNVSKTDTTATNVTTNLKGNTVVDTGVTVTSDKVVANSGALTTNVVNKGTITANFENMASSSFKNDGGTISGNIQNKGNIESSASALATASTSNTIQNDGLLKLTGGTISNAISELTTADAGTVEITNNVAVASTGSISNNIIKLTNGTLDLSAKSDASGNIDLTAATKIEANGGTLSVQDGKNGTITLGNVDTTASDLNVAIDADFTEGSTRDTDGVYIGSADKLSLASGKEVTGTNKIKISDIKIADTPAHSTDPYATEFKAQIADDTIKNSVDLSSTTLKLNGITNDAGDLLISYNDGWINGKHTDLKNAIASSIEQKMFSMSDGNLSGETGDLQLGGTSLSVTTNGNNITGANSISVKLASAGQTLSIIGTKDDSHTANTTISGFGTAIDNTAGGRVNLTDVTMTNNTKDIINNGEIDTSTDPDTERGVYLVGTNNINSIVDSDGTHTHGQTTVKSGTSTIGTIQQKSVTVDAGATANLTNVDNAATTDGITNNGDLVLAGGDATTAATNANKITMTAAAGNAKTTIAAGSNITNTQTMTQKEVVVSAGDESTTPATPAAKLTNNSTINADTINVNDSAELNNNSNIAAADGSSTAAVNVKSNADLNLNKGSNTKADVTLDAATSDLTITDNGKLSGGVKTSNGGSINLVADTQDISMNSAITGAITGADGTGNGSYKVTATSTPKTAPATPNTVTIDKAIAGATEVDVNADTVAVITDAAYTSTSTSTSAPVKVGDNGDLTLKNTTAGETTVGSAISALTATDKFDVTVDNFADGTTNINNTISGAKTVTGDGGVTNLNSTITGANAIIANDGTTNINAGSDNNTTVRIGTADIIITSGATAGVQTTSDNFVLTNDVTGANETSTLKLEGNSGTPGTASDPGTQFNIASDVNGGTVEIAKGQLNLPNEDKVASADGVKVDSGATLNTMNGATNNYNTNTEFADASQVKVDVNAINKASDRFQNPQQASGAGVVLTDIALQDLDKIVHRNTDIDLRGTTNLANVTVGDELLNKKFQAMTPIRMMEATINRDGLLNIHPSSGRNDYNSFNPAAVVAPIAAQMGGYLSQLNSYDEAFRNLDMKMLMTQEERQAYKMANRYASEVQPQVFSETYLPEKQSAGWFRPYASFERVGLKHGPGVSNVMYGSYFGGDSQMKELRNGWDYQWSVYVGYNGSHQAYAGQSIYQNGGNLGATGVWYKNNFFTALTANVGASVANASTTFGSEDFPMLMTGVASKTGYNWELAKGKFIIQPSYLMSYTFVNTFDYTNAAGVRINSDPLHAINITPGLKFIGNLKNGWQPYAGVQMVWSIMDQTNFHANDIPLPQMSVKPYFQYGVGLQKRWGERFTGFFQAMLRNGGRNGIALSAGFRWALGKSPSAKSTATQKTEKSKQTVVKQQAKKVIKSSSTKTSKLSSFLADMDGEQTYVVKVEK